ncbi:hypothetical protein OTB16_03500 [Streptomyces sp. H27-S2]|nr:hypothetical protein [Streptomyces sp. H27-S2]
MGGAVIGGVGGGVHGFVVADAVSDDSQIYFGTDPAHGDFGANRFLVDDGPVPLIEGGGPMDAHSNYFNPNKDKDSASNIPRIISGHAQDITTEEHR